MKEQDQMVDFNISYYIAQAPLGLAPRTSLLPSTQKQMKSRGGIPVQSRDLAWLLGKDVRERPQLPVFPSVGIQGLRDQPGH